MSRLPASSVSAPSAKSENRPLGGHSLELDLARGLVRSGTATLPLVHSLGLLKALAMGVSDTITLQLHLKISEPEDLHTQVMSLDKRLSLKFGVDWIFEYRYHDVRLNPAVTWTVR